MDGSAPAEPRRLTTTNTRATSWIISEHIPSNSRRFSMSQIIAHEPHRLALHRAVALFVREGAVAPDTFLSPARLQAVATIVPQRYHWSYDQRRLLWLLFFATARALHATECATCAAIQRFAVPIHRLSSAKGSYVSAITCSLMHRYFDVSDRFDRHAHLLVHAGGACFDCSRQARTRALQR